MAPRILAADDDEDVRLIIETKLGEEFDVVTVSDGSQAWESLTAPASVRPTLVILDVMMPEMDGFETLKRIRDHDELADLPVIMLTSRGREDDVMRALELDADDFVTKPFSSAELKGRVTRLLG